jgi:hypothetical protein
LEEIALFSRKQQTVGSSPASIAFGVLQRKCACGQHAGGGECDQCKGKKGILQRHSSGSTGTMTAPPIVHDVLRSPGQALDTGSQRSLEHRTGHDFSGVRVHTDRRSEESARAVNALAYTVGSHIVFGANQYAPWSDAGQRLLVHELTHTLQQGQQGSSHSSLAIVESAPHEREAESASAGVSAGHAMFLASHVPSDSLLRHKDGSDGAPAIDRTFELDPKLFLVPMDAPAEKEKEKCEEFPGGSTDCELDEKTGTPTGKVSHRVDEKNACTKPCVEEHEGVHVKQLKTLCPALRECYLAADKGKRPATDCAKMAMFGAKRECEAYNVSVPCVEKRVRSAPECQTKENKSYGARKLASEKCFQEKYCAGAGAK